MFMADWDLQSPVRANLSKESALEAVTLKALDKVHEPEFLLILT